MSETGYTFTGRCHCGGISVELTLPRSAEETQVRACQCGFCTRHGSLTVSDGWDRAQRGSNGAYWRGSPAESGCRSDACKTRRTKKRGHEACSGWSPQQKSSRIWRTRFRHTRHPVVRIEGASLEGIGREKGPSRSASYQR